MNCIVSQFENLSVLYSTQKRVIGFVIRYMLIVIRYQPNMMVCYHYQFIFDNLH